MFAVLQSSKHLPPFKIQIVQLVQAYYIWYVDLAVVLLSPGSLPGNNTGDEKCCYIVSRFPQSTFWCGGQILSCCPVAYVLQQ